MPAFKGEIDWTVLPSDLAGAFTDLGLELEQAQTSIEGTWDIVGPQEAIDAANILFVEFGVEAARLSTKFRRAHGLPEYRPRVAFDAIFALEEQLKRQKPGALQKTRSKIRNVRRRIRRLWLQITGKL